MVATVKPQPRCHECGTKAGSVRKHYKLDPRNYAQRFALMCSKCARQDGWAAVDHQRTWAGGPPDARKSDR